MMKRLILFGAGKNGIAALEKYGRDKVKCFCDNDKHKQGLNLKGIPVVSFDEMINLIDDDCVIMITPFASTFLIGQLEKAGIRDYLLYHDYKREITIYSKEENEIEREHNNRLRNLVIQSSKSDLLEDISDFKRLVKEAVNDADRQGYMLNYIKRGNEEEGFRYGNISVLLDYAGIQADLSGYLPTVSHVDCLPYYTVSFEYKTAVIMSGEYYKNRIHKIYPWVPVFTVGPYIYYAKSIYDENKLIEKKKEVGTMLLVFLPHNLEDTDRGLDGNKFINDIIDMYSKKFDSIWLCAYFADINRSVCEYAEKKGIHVVTAGFRFDQRFDDRLKTMLTLADAVCFGDIGTFVTYSIAMKKPMSRIDIKEEKSVLDMQYKDEGNIDIQHTPDYNRFNNDFLELFGKEFAYSDEQIQWMNPLGGFDKKRSREYIRDVFRICDDIWKRSLGNIMYYPNAVRQVYFEYNNIGDVAGMSILKEAVGGFVD